MTIPLNIVMSYPVHWSLYKIFRDFIQNFYDSVGYKDFSERFKFEYENKKLTMWIEDKTFNYEWLLHIGASTKTFDSDNNAGYFGEGFKIASLCAFRDYQIDVQMESENWKINVQKDEKYIDNQKVFMLSYELSEKENENLSRLTLSNIDESQFKLFKTTIDSFYYPENKILGEKIWEDSKCAVYTRSHYNIPNEFPKTFDFDSKGAVFCTYQMLGTNPFDLVVCLHNFKKEDRERDALYSFDVIKIFTQIIEKVDSLAAMKILEKMQHFWSSYPSKSIDIHTWYFVIQMLTEKIAKNEEVKKNFMKKYENLLCCRQVKTISERNKRVQARSWLKSQIKYYKLVNDAFLELNYKTLEEKCEEDGGFVLDDSVKTSVQKKCFEILENFIQEAYSDFFLINEFGFPERKVITNMKSTFQGMASLVKCQPRINSEGLIIKNKITTIYLKEYIFKKELFNNALSTYIHEMCHIFGGDLSQKFSQALTFAIEVLISNNDLISKSINNWYKVFEEEKK